LGSRSVLDALAASEFIRGRLARVSLGHLLEEVLAVSLVFLLHRGMAGLEARRVASAVLVVLGTPSFPPAQRLHGTEGKTHIVLPAREQPALLPLDPLQREVVVLTVSGAQMLPIVDQFVVNVNT
jgi:hypothetical protein